jgi:hypothetical protein
MSDGSKSLEIAFNETVARPSGNCPLPEPGRGAPHFEHPQTVRIEKQPTDYDYDKKDNKAESERFIALVQEAVSRGEITKEEAEKLLETEEV